MRRIINSLVVDLSLSLKLTRICGLGSILGLALVIQILTGVFLAMHYVADTGLAFMSVEHMGRKLEGFSLLLTCGRIRDKWNDTIYRKYLAILGGLRLVSTMVTGLLDIYRNSALAEVMRDQEGDLLSESYKKRRNNKMGGYYITVITGIYVLSKFIVRLVSKFSFIALPIGVSVSCFIIILIYNIGMWRELCMMVGAYRDKKRRGVYNIQSTHKRGIRGVPGGGKDLLRLGVKAVKAAGGGILGTAAGIEAANTIGRGFGEGDVGTKAVEKVTKKAGLHKSVREGDKKEGTSKKG